LPGFCSKASRDAAQVGAERATWWTLGAVLRPFLLASIILAADARTLALDPQKQIGQFGHENWTAQRGLPGEAVYQVLQTKDGYLWIRTGAGLSRFDGEQFVSMDARIGAGTVKAICIGADGDLLIRTATRTLIYKDRQFSDYRPGAALLDGSIRLLFESSKHVLFIGSDAFIYRIEKNGQPTVLRDRTGWINCFLEDHTGKIWIAGSPNIYVYANDKLSVALDGGAVSSTVTTLLEDHLHRIWAGTGSGLFRVNQRHMRLEPQDRPSPKFLRTIIEDNQGNLWAGTEKSGVARIDAKGYSTMGFAAGLTDDSVLSLLEDREGNIWIGTGSGLDQLRETKLTTFTTREGLQTNRVKSAISTSDGVVNVFTDSGGLARIENGIAKPFKHNDRLPSLVAAAQFQSRDGSIWVGTLGGLTRIQNETVTVFSGQGHFSKNYVSAISEDDESLIVTNSELRAFRFKNGQVLPFTIRGKTAAVTDSGVYTFTIYRDASGTLWFGTNKGLFKARGDGRDEGAFEANIKFGVTSIYDDGHGSLWLGGRTPGVVQFRIRDGRVTSYTRQDGLFDGSASSILADGQGDLWVSTADGIYSVSQNEMESFAEGKIKTVSSNRYGLADGMKTTEATDVESQPAGCRTSDGKLWFTTKKGIVAVDPKRINYNHFIPPVIIESVISDGVSEPLNKELTIGPGIKGIEFHFTALSLKIPERVRFKYQLEGYDHEWIDAGSRRVSYYTNLPPGGYRFRVIAANDDGVWNELGSSVAITLKPHFYQTRLFLITCILIALAAAYGANRVNTRRIRIQAERLSKMVEARTEDLRKSQNELEQMAHYDALTGLPNRRLFTSNFLEMVGSAREKRFALLLIDVDKFKSINDRFGHDAGDAFLVEASHRLLSAVRSIDVVSRLGGDEFAILIRGDQSETDLQNICERIMADFSEAIDVKGGKVVAGVSIGIASFPEDGDTHENLYKAADIALYEAKRLGRGTSCKYNPELAESWNRHEVSKC